MNKKIIEGVKIKELKFIPDERGRLIEILRSDDKIFESFGQVYVTTAYPNVVKAWHLHKKQNDFISCIKGMIKLVLFDDRKTSKTRGIINEFFIGDYSPLLIKIPKNVWHGFKCISDKEAIVINIPTTPYNNKNPDEFRIPYNAKEINYDWELKFK
jgi:dTDP-4-dehydrorhamnose 3,5-epimerase